MLSNNHAQGCALIGVNTMHIESIEKNWNLCILEYGEESPMQNHGAMELAADDENKRIYAAALMVSTYGLNSILAACRGYVNRAKS